MFVETENVDYRLPTTENNFRRLQQINGGLAFPFSVCSKQTEIGNFR
jgi:hypothetical protein